MVGYGDEFVGDMACQLLLYTVGCGATWRYESNAMAYTEDVCVYGKGCFSPYDGLDYVGGLASYTRQAH